MWHLGNATAAENELAENFFQQAIDLDPAFAGGYRGLAWAQMFSASQFQRRSLKEVQASAGELHIARFNSTAPMLRLTSVSTRPDHPPTYRWLAAALGQLGRTAKARAALEKAIGIGPASFDMYVRNHAPWWSKKNYEHMLDGLRKAGWIE